jgi:glutamate racemase
MPADIPTANFQPIGVFDSGYGGLTVLKEFVRTLPGYDYLYLGDNARTPYGARSFETVHQYTLEAVLWLFARGCQLVILACNTASAKALRTIQQENLPLIDPARRVLGVIRPVTEAVGYYTQTRHIGILGTAGTVLSRSYPIEIAKFYPDMIVTQEACPMWVPLVENNEFDSIGADYFVQKHIESLLAKDPLIDTLILGCTHYPLLLAKIHRFLPDHITIISQAALVAKRLADYLNEHPKMAGRCSQHRLRQFYTTDSTEIFDRQARIFYGEPIEANQVRLA